MNNIENVAESYPGILEADFFLPLPNIGLKTLLPRHFFLSLASASAILLRPVVDVDVDYLCNNVMDLNKLVSSSLLKELVLLLYSRALHASISKTHSEFQS